MNISYDSYRVFYYVAKYHSFTQAAVVLMSNQPNVTRTIKNLEQALGCKLFIRSSRGAQLTPEGEQLYAHISLAFAHIQSGEEELAISRGLHGGVVTISASEISLRCCLLPILKAYRFRYPGVRVRLSNHSTPQAIDVLKNGERFSDNQRIEGTIPEMLDEALLFVKRNMRTKTIISPTTGRRTDRTDYPITAVREAIINALVHRDYSIHTEGMPIQLIMFEDRIEIHNPGGLYGRITIDQLGKIQPDTRNPVLASALETLGIIENRYSGIPTIRMEMEKYNLRQPEFLDERGSFIVKLYKESKNDYEDMSNDEETNNLIVFCKTPRTRKEICDYLGLNSVTYAIQTYVNPLVEAGVIKLSIPDKPKSPKQLYYSVEREE